jgi:hypothetical protein
MKDGALRFEDEPLGCWKVEFFLKLPILGFYLFGKLQPEIAAIQFLQLTMDVGQFTKRKVPRSLEERVRLGEWKNILTLGSICCILIGNSQLFDQLECYVSIKPLLQSFLSLELLFNGIRVQHVKIHL